MRPSDLALDLSTRTGWAFGVAGSNEPPKYGYWVLDRKPTLIERDLQIGYRMSCLASVLTDHIAIYRPDRITVEAPLHLADASSRLLICLAGAVAMVCEEEGVEYVDGHLSRVRKMVLGRSNWPNVKAEVMRFCQAQGWSPADHNVGDALILLRYAHIMRRAHVMA
jgi:Holliday junction resolvasome RuvABC endonuclease subunit